VASLRSRYQRCVLSWRYNCQTKHDGQKIVWL
jgi:hypothetical protein